MDFRENWLRNFRAVVDMEIARAGGDAPSGRRAVALNLEKGEPTIYQHYTQKSGKVYPTVEMMALLEKKYGAGRPVGWSSADLNPSDAALNAPVASLQGALRVIAQSLEGVEPSTREVVAGMLSNLAKAPEIHSRVAVGIEALLGVKPASKTGEGLGGMSTGSLNSNQRAA